VQAVAIDWGNAFFWSGSLLRLANGSTPISKRSAIGRGEIASVAGVGGHLPGSE
jgi:hypothetical protein